MQLIDSHCHLNFAPYQKDRAEVILRAQKQNMGLIIVGTNYQTSQEAVRIAQEHENIWAAIGLHPIHLAQDLEEKDSFDKQEYKFTTKAEKFDKRRYFELARQVKVVAIGESGLDYFHLKNYCGKDLTETEYVALQKETLYEILGFSREVKKPLIFHCRDSYDDLLELLAEFDHNGTGVEEKVRGVVHCFTGNLEQAEKILTQGLYLGFTGIITFPNAQALQAVVKHVPLNRILIETDAPYLAPQPKRGQRNEPLYVQYVASKIAELKNISLTEVYAQTTKNATALFNL
ncbi:MAG: hypothetical protein A2233_00135 [Candidatus Kerfeldbacteria bacterium RIFOXYA2_FULL_38_24]|uniref:Hydrolase TatD n=1 Tax=Candidatus Kerfeldbacteria bacterium RIFOXYB2_FULL_38_14 TaxID=1798547 RepID=A0A1G2B9W6_9BACT|nr:MAG: hypothetical protein A2233_00135 [Candidatus Kerfeldbacteria bacterium RIFOXYA2_FULL_38_24]OGY86003.1 MAG: hypothetical protein A2319_00340 [Candidatus Kerfeldbacteria bacterium RIFOXYB2_FULL_38_14]